MAGAERKKSGDRLQMKEAIDKYLRGAEQEQ